MVVNTSPIPANNPAPLTAAQARALRERINTLSLELETCKTPAEIRCVKESIVAAEAQLSGVAS